ncbi:hypothetical protein FHS04_001256 [Mesoflavibacter sabulilitoris]|uniref:Uncharacterized protein n=1 Tax=Mesoflavibacter zeaxanthinifaciens subsp. sabulilitoris TaxID=1520893 RepID=A0A2T1NAH5_9FLAO|nr:hypothetical protein [Mesoflavibacter zeaxanthinifaciens]MBB3123753.1 hypothetical protein [Mesoflavibacter zeaxanthinifaciens subsp. sabulilitoris]PSG89128.1 hypothetical protein C7H61_09220 [Mesoflavibacter zeaxanthinifaciens subsp. sabulilitoris]
MTKIKSEFQNKVYSFFENRYIGKIIELKPASLNRHYIKFKPMNSVWFQEFSDSIDVDSVDFENNSISGFISNSSKLICH